MNHYFAMVRKRSRVASKECTEEVDDLSRCERGHAICSQVHSVGRASKRIVDQRSLIHSHARRSDGNITSIDSLPKSIDMALEHK